MHPSPSSSARARPRARLASLPSELLKQIVNEVHKQDKACVDLNQGPSPFSSDPESMRAFQPRGLRKEDGADCVWSYWYGRGIIALSYVDKRLRAVALPQLVETVMTKQLAQSFATRYLPSSPLAPLIRRVALDPHPGIADAVPVLQHLPQLRGLGFGANLHYKLFEPAGEPRRDEDSVFIRHVLALVAPRLTELEIGANMSQTVADCINLVAGAPLRKLKVMSLGTPFDEEAEEFKAALARLDSLEELEVFDGNGYVTMSEAVVPQLHPAWHDFTLPSVTTLRLVTESPLYRSFLPFVQTAFPSIQRLYLQFCDAEEYSYEELHPPVHLPHLRYLSLAQPNILCGGLVQHVVGTVRSSPIKHITILADTDELSGDLIRLLPENDSLPSTLRTVTVTRMQGPPAVPLAEREMAAQFERECGARLVVVPRPCEVYNLDWQDKRRRDWPEYKAFSDVEFAECSLDGIVAWAARRIEGLARLGDRVGLEEMLEALKPVRERRWIEEL
ncbi:hypothetical protein JCM10450v2_004984 [Rhodotorula kratochvilovae]